MNTFLPMRRMAERVEIDKTEGDTATFFSLLYFGEMVTKLVVAGMVAAVTDDRDRIRYRLLYRLVRADGVGEWAGTLDEILTGPTSQHLQPQSRIEQRELTQKFAAESWQFKAVLSLRACASILSIQADPVGSSAALRQWFPIFASIRNKTRGHGAPRGSDCSEACQQLEESILLITENFNLFRRPWAYLHKNLSGKYRITPISEDTSPFQYLRTDTTGSFANGMYVAFDVAVPIELIHSDADASDFLFANGHFRAGKYDVLSYITNQTGDADGSVFTDPIQPLPPSETQPAGVLDGSGKTFTNIPPMQTGYIARDDLEKSLSEQLLIEPHPIITLTGSGGIGKTSTALAVLHKLIASMQNRFDLVIWFSARDIDLLEHGPKPVQPHSISLSDFAEAYTNLVQPKEALQKGFDPVEYFSRSLSSTPLGPTLYVFDNFETVVSPLDVFKWIDTYIRTPNKVLITTRNRAFAGDYPIEVHGMTERQAKTLIEAFSGQLGIRALITPEYVSELIEESEGHPYVIKIMLGEVAKLGRIAKPERIVATREEILTALFERTYATLSAPAQRTFLLLCNWKSVIPELAIEAVVLRPGNERLDVRKALDDLRRSSLIEEIESPQDGEIFVSVPLVASIFGKRKLTASPLKAAVDADTTLLRDFGAARKEDVLQGVHPRIRRLLSRLAERISNQERTLEQIRPILEFLAHRSPSFWLDVADFYRDQASPQASELAKDALRRYLEAPTIHDGLSSVWRRLADLCASTADYAGEVHALVAMCEAKGAPLEVVSAAANRINNINSALKRIGLTVFDTDERKILIRRVAQAMEAFRADLDPVDCSRLAWLYLHLGDNRRAKDIADYGLGLDSENEYCRRILAKFS